MSLAPAQEKGLLLLAVGEAFPLPKLTFLSHLRDFPPHASLLPLWDALSSSFQSLVQGCRRGGSAAEEAPEQL